MVLLQKKRKVIIIGHKNPDTDSICSAIAYAALKNQIAGNHFEARRAGEINEETRFVLKYIGVKKPKHLEDVRTQVKDIDIRYTEGAQRDFSLMKAWKIMKKLKSCDIACYKRRETGRNYYHWRYYSKLYGRV